MRASRFVLALCSGLLLLPQLVLADHGAPINGGGGPGHEFTPPPASSSPTPVSSGRKGREFEPINTPGPLKVSVSSPLPEKFCTNLTTINSTIGDTTNDRFDDLHSGLSKNSAQIRTNMSGLEKKLSGARSEADGKRHKDFADLLAKATTPEQKKAIATFETTMNQAVNTERAAIDAANTTFEQGLLSAMSSRSANLSAAAATYKGAVAAALVTAKADCQAGTDPATVRTTLQNALKTARSNFNAAIQNAQASGPDVTALKSARQAAVNAATTAFRSTVQQALATLKAALGTTSSPTPTVSPTP